MLEFNAADEVSAEEEVVLTKRDGSKEEYVIRPFSCGDRNLYLTNVVKRFQPDGDGGEVIRDFVGLEAALLTKCMFHKKNNRLVTEKEVNAFPPKFASLVFARAKVVCALDEDAEETAKND